MDFHDLRLDVAGKQLNWYKQNPVSVISVSRFVGQEVDKQRE